jgi:sulfur carrier protein
VDPTDRNRAGNPGRRQARPVAWTDVKVVLRNPRREVEVNGPLTVSALLERLDVNPESVLVIRGDTLVTRDARLTETDTVEIRPVTSGGAS